MGQFFGSEYPDQTQLLDTVPGGARESLPEEISAPKPRTSIPKPLARTSSVMPGAVIPEKEKVSIFGGGAGSIGAPLGASTPAVKTNPPVQSEPSSETLKPVPVEPVVPKVTAVKKADLVVPTVF